MKSRASNLLVLLILVTLVLTSCGPKPTPEEVPTAAPPPTEAPAVTTEEWSLAEAAAPWEGETLRVIGEALPPLEALEELKSEFEDITGVEVVIEGLGHEEALEKVTLDFAGQTGVYDMVLQPHRALGKFVEAGWVRPIGEFYEDPALRNPDFSFEEDLLSELWFRETCTYRGEIYGLPFHFISMYLWYRYDWFEHPDEKAAFEEEYGYELPSPPVTWQEYLDTAEFFTRKAGDTLAGEVLDQDVYGHAWGAARHVTSWYDYINVLYSFGGREIYLPDNRGDSYGPIGINSDEAVEAMEYIIKTLPYAPPGTLTYTWDEKQAASQTGLVAMAIQWDDATFAVEDPAQSEVSGKIAYSGVPIGEEKIIQIEGWDYLIPTSSKKPELAWLFVQWAMGKEVQIAQMKKGGESALRPTYEDEEVASIPYAPTGVYVKTGGEWVLSVREEGDPTGTGDTSVTLVSKPTFPEEEVITEAMVLGVNRALREEVSAKEALDDVAAEFERILPD